MICFVHRHIKSTADGSGGGKDMRDREADNSMNVSSLPTKAWFTTLQKMLQSIRSAKS